MAWFAGAVTIGCLVVALLHLGRVVAEPAGRIGDASSAAGALAMAAMFSPLGDPVPLPVWIAVFAALSVWAAAMAVRERGIGGDAGHHLLCSGAMLFMVAGHGAHGGGLGMASVVALVAAGYFAWHGLRCVDRYRVALRGAPRSVAGVHLATTVVMSGMLVAMI